MTDTETELLQKMQQLKPSLVDQIDVKHLRDMHRRLVQNYNHDVPFEQFEEDRLVLLNAIEFLEDVAKRVRIGDKVYFVLEDDIPEHRFFLSEETVTDVSDRGIFTSAFDPAEDDHGNFTPWDEIGKEVFRTKQEAEREINRRARDT
jgi:hypothetical protein